MTIGTQQVVGKTVGRIPAGRQHENRSAACCGADESRDVLPAAQALDAIVGQAAE